MRVQKRNGELESVSFDKVLQRIRKASKGLAVNPDALAQQVLARIVDKIRTAELDELTAQMAASLCTTHGDWGILASRIAVSNHQKNTAAPFSEVMGALARQRGPTGEPMSYLDEAFLAFVRQHAATLDAYMKHERDYEFDYFGFKTLEKAYLMRDTERRVLERPQHMWMRVAVGIWFSYPDAAVGLARALETYDLLSQKFMTHATPTLFNAGTPRPQMSSCFVAGTLVHTMDGVKPIESVCLGDMVVTHTGEVKPVTQLHTNALGDRDLFTLKIAGTPSLHVTGNHRLWSISDEQEKWGKAPGWNRVDYLRVGDWVMIPEKESKGDDIIIDVKTYLDTITGDDTITYNYEYKEDKVYTTYTYTRRRGDTDVTCTKKGPSFNRYWRFDTRMMELIGIWIGDGCIVHAKNSNGNMFPRSLNVVSYYNNEKLIEFVTKTFYEYLGVEHVTLSTDSHGMTCMTINNTIVAHIFKAMFKSKFDGKRLPAFFNKMSKEHIQYFLAGLVSSDGCVSKQNSITIQLTNPPLVNDIFHLARSVGFPVTLTMMTSRTDKPTGRMGIPQYIVAGKVKKYYDDERLDALETYNDDSLWNKVRRIDGKLFMRIGAKDYCTQDHDVVYTLGVEDNHSYSVGGIIAENCYLLAMDSDSIAGIYKTLGDCAAISKYAGGIGLHLHNIRARGSLIRGTNGTSNGLVPMLRVFNNTARYVDQCFVPETCINVKNGLFKKIVDIKPGDEVMTSGCIEEVDETGKHYVKPISNSPVFCKVVKKVEHTYSGTLYHLTFDSGITVKVTPKHPFLAQMCYGEFDYTEVEKLSTGTMIRSPDGNNGFSILEKIETEEVSDITLYDLEVDGIHDYAVTGAGFAHNGGGKRNGSFAMYLEPWHADVEDFLRMKLPTGTEEERARDLFYALWISDLFMRRVETDTEWSLFCPNEAPGLADVWGAEFEALYERYEREGKARKTVSARKLWFQILDTQMETGTPYLLYKDAANRKSNQQNLGTIKSSNLCTEIIEYSSPEETAVCNLASIALPAFTKARSAFGEDSFDFEALRRVVRVATRNLNRVIDINFYPTPETKRSNMRHRPIGLGVQGLADVFAILGIAWESEEAAALNQKIFEHIYYAALQESVELAKLEGPYETFNGSPASRGQLQFDMWQVEPLSTELDWATIRDTVRKHGLRNSLLVAPMPTASTSQILGYNECFEPFTTNLYTRRTLAGEFIVVNKYLTKELMGLGLWSDAMKQRIVAANGSVQGIEEIPEAVRNRYKTSWEIPQKVLIDMAAARGAFICQSQSLNLFVADPTYSKLTSMHFYAWKKGLKTGCYYLRTKAPVAAQKFTIDPRLLAAVNGPTGPAGPLEDDDSVVASDDEEDAVVPAAAATTETHSQAVRSSAVAETRAQKLERLAREYEEEQAKAKAAAEDGEGCVYCSA